MTRQWCQRFISSPTFIIVTLVPFCALRYQRPLVSFEKLSTGDSSPTLVLANEGEGIDGNVRTLYFVFKDDEPGWTRAGEPLLELVLNVLKRDIIGSQAPV